MIFGLARCALAASVAAALLVSSAPVGAAAGFGDVPADAFYTEAVQWMSDTGITRGTAPGCFDPDAPATRAEVVPWDPVKLSSPDRYYQPANW